MISRQVGGEEIVLDEAELTTTKTSGYIYVS